MKKLLFASFLAVTFAVAAQAQPIPDPCGVGGCTDTLQYTIKNDQGATVDHIAYDRDVGIPYNEAMLLKYVRLSRCLGKETSTYLEVLELLEGGQDFESALKAKLAE